MTTDNVRPITPEAEVLLGTSAHIQALSESEPELGAVLCDILRELRHAENAAITVVEALKGMDLTESVCAADVAQVSIANPLSEQLDRLEDAIANARLPGSRLVVVKPAVEGVRS